MDIQCCPFPAPVSHRRNSAPATLLPETKSSAEAKADSNRICVFVRFRDEPDPQRFTLSSYVEDKTDKQTCNNIVELIAPKPSANGISKHGVISRFYFERVFAPPMSQKLVFEVVAVPLIERFIEGTNAAIIAYGQSGTGKTHTMLGSVDEDGIIPRASSAIFSRIQDLQSVEIYMEIIEIYMEELRDLFSKVPEGKGGSNLRIREFGPHKGQRSSGPNDSVPKCEPVVEGTVQRQVKSPQDVMQNLLEAGRRRAKGETSLNKHSSRSHLIITISLSRKPSLIPAQTPSVPPDTSTFSSCSTNCQASYDHRRCRLHFVDLAGSERVGKSGVEGIALDEGKKINLSLTCLGKVIGALVDGKKPVPFRDSKLTRILQSSLGGNSLTHVICTVSGQDKNASETLSTLQFGSKSRTIENAIVDHSQWEADQKKTVITDLSKEIADLKAQIATLTKKSDGAGTMVEKLVDQQLTDEEEEYLRTSQRQVETEIPACPPPRLSETEKIMSSCSFGRAPTSLDPLIPDSAYCSIRQDEVSWSDDDADGWGMDKESISALAQHEKFHFEISRIEGTSFEDWREEEEDARHDYEADEEEDFSLNQELDLIGWEKCDEVNGGYKRKGGAEMKPKSDCRECRTSRYLQELVDLTSTTTSAALFSEYKRLAQTYAHTRIREAELVREVDSKTCLIRNLTEALNSAYHNYGLLFRQYQKLCMTQRKKLHHQSRRGTGRRSSSEDDVIRRFGSLH